MQEGKHKITPLFLSTNIKIAFHGSLISSDALRNVTSNTIFVQDISVLHICCLF
jgi:hypothetical protein